ncbi:fanconi anemia group A protein homolog [Elysia marginata]|uniref:Fanconi anemia group A protein homolog n=1 Tax=Elysia marginata TaxID=1093978 RepID=A0AAV4JHY4_9GAST|nr:fanconi anemia group A protein homolog [Elysia marginata]
MELYIPFFLARMSSAIGPHCFPSYSDWFQATFCSPSSLVLSKASYTLLIKFLSSLVPGESPERLKTYIFHKPNRPDKCKDLYEDFVDLAKTRLMDLGIPLREKVTSMYGNIPSTSKNLLEDDQMNRIRAVDSAEQDVQRAVASFAESRKIPTVLMQASIFQKPYFVGRFLPALLKPRVLPDCPDERMLLIAELNRSGKIQASTYNQYVQACEREKHALLEGVFDIDDDDEMLELSFPLVEQLQKRLNKFTDAVLTGTDPAKTGCVSSVVDKVSAIVAELSPSPSDKPSNVTKESVVVDLSKSPLVPDDNISKISTLLLEQMSSLVTQWREQTRGQHPDQSLPSALFTPVVQLIQTLLQQFPTLRPRLYSTLLAILNKKQKTKCGDLSNPGLPIMCLCLVNLPYTVTLITKEEQNRGDYSFMQAVLLCLDIVNGSDHVFRFCLDYAEIACNWLTVLEQQLDQHDIIELGSACVTEEDLLPPDFVKNVNFVCKRIGVIEIDGSHSSHLKEKKLVRQAFVLYSKDRWQQLHKKHQVSLVEWVEMEWSVSAALDPLSATERLSYLMKTSRIFLKQSSNLLPFCKTVLLTLAKLEGSQSCVGYDSGNSDLKSADFIQLLRALLGNLSEYDENKETFLVEILQCSGANTNQIIRYVLELPSQLLFCDSLQQDFESKLVLTALKIIDYFTQSSQNKGAYLSLKATGYILQGTERLVRAHPTIPATALDSLWMHPFVFTSFLVHNSIKAKVGITGTSSEAFSTLKIKMEATDLWLKGLTENKSLQQNDETDLPCLEDWQKAAALFPLILHSKFSFDANKLRLQETVQCHLLEMLAANLTRSGAVEEVKVLKLFSVVVVVAVVLVLVAEVVVVVVVVVVHKVVAVVTIEVVVVLVTVVVVEAVVKVVVIVIAAIKVGVVLVAEVVVVVMVVIAVAVVGGAAAVVVLVVVLVTVVVVVVVMVVLVVVLVVAVVVEL